MQYVKRLNPIVALCLVLTPIFSYAHHSLTNYDLDTLVEIEGEVTRMAWRNPHILIEVTHITDTGEEEQWAVSGGPVNQMERRGISRDGINEGDIIKVSGIASNYENDLSMMPVAIQLANGENLIVDAEHAETFGLLSGDDTLPTASVFDPEVVEAAIRDAHGLYRVWTNTHWIDEYRDWGESALPLTPSAQAAQDGWVQLEDDLALRCIKAGMPEALINPFPIQFIEQGDDILLKIEEWENIRTIHMSGTSDGQPHSPLGYSVGHWEGNTLVIETDKINAPFFDDRGTPQTEDVTIVERFTLSEDESSLDWVGIVTDEATFTQPMKMPEFHWEWVPGQEIKTYGCTPDTAGTPWGARRGT